jgi:hypothetical protein
MEDDANYHFNQIHDYEFEDGVLLFKAQYMGDDIGNTL